MKSPLLRLLGIGCIVLWLLLLTDGVLPQIQMYLFGGRLVVPSVILKVLLLVSLAAAVPLNPAARIPRGIFWAWLAFASYLALIAIIFQYRFDYSLGDVLTTYSGYYYFILIAPLFFYLESAVSEKRMVRWLLVVLVPLAALGILQQVLNDPILPTRSRDGLFVVNQWRWFGFTRGFSLTSSGAQFGHYLSLVAAVSTVLLFRKRTASRAVGGFFLVLTLVATFATLTRGAYLEVLLTILTAAALCRWPLMVGRRVRMLSVAYGILGMVLIVTASTVMVSDSDEQTLFGSRSSQIRTERWADYLGETVIADLPTLLTGTGIVQTREIADRLLVIDNTLIAVFVHIGVVGLVLWAALMWQIWSFVAARLRVHPHHVLMVAVAAAMSVWLFRGMIRLAFTYYSLLPLLVILAHWDMPRVQGLRFPGRRGGPAASGPHPHAPAPAPALGARR